MSVIIPAGNILSDLGDCTKLTLDRMDVIKRTLRCNQIEIFDVDEEVSFTSLEEEAEASPLTFTDDGQSDDDEARTMQLINNLDCLLRRIEQFQLLVMERREQEATANSQDVETLEDSKRSPPALTCQEKLELRNLQHKHHLLQFQMDELMCLYRTLREMFQRMRLLMSNVENELRQMGNLVQEFQKWAEEAIKEVNICQERHKYFQSKKITKSEAHLVAKNHIALGFKRSKPFLLKRVFARKLFEFHAEIDELMQYGHEVRQEINRRFDKIEGSLKTTGRCRKTKQEQQLI